MRHHLLLGFLIVKIFLDQPADVLGPVHPVCGGAHVHGQLQILRYRKGDRNILDSRDRYALGVDRDTATSAQAFFGFFG